MSVTPAQQPLYSLIYIDSRSQHEQIPHGVPTSYDWYGGAVTHAENRPYNGSTLCPYTNPYGQLYTVATGNPQPGAKVEIRELKQWTLDATTGQWTCLFDGTEQLGGALYPENFQGASAGSPIETPSWLPGSIVVAPTPGYLFHVYQAGGRALMADPTNLAGVAITCRARLVPGSFDPSGPDPGLIYDVGADYWSTAGAGALNASPGQGRFKTVKPDWRVFAYATLGYQQLNAGVLPPLTADPGELY